MNDMPAQRGEAGGTRAIVPVHVVYRQFPAEVILLNLDTGHYHALNRTAATMFEAVAREEISASRSSRSHSLS